MKMFLCIVVRLREEKRKDMPKRLATFKLKKDDVKTLHCISAMKWQDKKDVYLISTMHSNVDLTKRGQKIGKNGEEQGVIKSVYVLEYNDETSGVDKRDQLLAFFSVIRKFVRDVDSVLFCSILVSFASTSMFCILKSNATPKKASCFRLYVTGQLIQHLLFSN